MTLTLSVPLHHTQNELFLCAGKKKKAKQPRKHSRCLSFKMSSSLQAQTLHCRLSHVAEWEDEASLSGST